MKVAIVHDWLNQIGGAERVLEALVDLFPSAPVYTSIYQPEAMPAAYRCWDIRTTWMDRLPAIHRHHQPYLLLYPQAFGGLQLAGYDLVISNKSAFCFGCRVAPGTRHVCYCLTPTRFVWNFDGYVHREQVGAAARLARPFIGWLQRWERSAAARVDDFISISREVQSRVESFYGRQSAIVYPPVDTRRFVPASPGGSGDYYLVVSRLIPYKRIDLAVRAFNRLGLPLWIGGDGRDRASLEAMAGPNVRFLGRVSEDELPGLMARCKAFVFPGLEDFGITPVEAMAAGRPVVAYGRGGALDYVVDGVTGALFADQTPEALADAVRRLEAITLDPAAIRRHALQFDTDRFKAKMRTLVNAYVPQPSGLQEASWN
ncbi:MAG: glycosyltransferase [Anaerolineae bacterium]|nr:glycosyltransferase [Anaerolineae bacterium]